MADVVAAALPEVIGDAALCVLLGDGERHLEEQFAAAALRYPGRIAFRVGYEEPLAHRRTPSAHSKSLRREAFFSPTVFSRLQTGRDFRSRKTAMVIETIKTVEISNPAEESPAISWAAVAAGAIAAAALTLVLLAFGAGMGFSAVSPWGNSGVSATTFQIGTGVYLICVAMLASAIGGYLAGRLRTKWVGVHTHEVFFRDTAHGFLAWGFATVLSAAFLAAAASNIAGGASSAGVSAIQSAGSGGPVDYYVDALLRSNPTASPNATDLGATHSEIARILMSGLREGDIPAPDRTYVAQVVAARTGLSQADADKRVVDVINQAKTALDNARKVAAKLSLWMTASLLIGAFSASLAATDGGYVRDNWNPSLTGR